MSSGETVLGVENPIGVLLVDKPAGASSFAMVKSVRRLLGIKKVGHAGTLDPFATGLLVICAGRPATKMIDQFMQGEKTYIATLQLGVETTTLDPEGEITSTHDVPTLASAEIDACLDTFKGPQMQAPPAFSAAKHKGKPLYHYARKGIMIQKEPKAIVIHDIKCLGFTADTLEIEVKCSRGTYIRVLAADIGKMLKCGAHLVQLRRTVSGQFNVKDSLPGAALHKEMTKEQLYESMMSVEDALKQTEKECA